MPERGNGSRLLGGRPCSLTSRRPMPWRMTFDDRGHSRPAELCSARRSGRPGGWRRSTEITCVPAGGGLGSRLIGPARQPRCHRSWAAFQQPLSHPSNTALGLPCRFSSDPMWFPLEPTRTEPGNPPGIGPGPTLAREASVIQVCAAARSFLPQGTRPQPRDTAGHGRVAASVAAGIQAILAGPGPSLRNWPERALRPQVLSARSGNAGEEPPPAR